MCDFQSIIVVIALNLIKNSVNTEVYSHFGLTTEQIIVKYGYPFENHTVQTSDGYLLTLHRIPYGVKNRNISKIRPPVLLMHGFLSCSADFILIGPDKALGFLLADAGYDVWLGNHRGTTLSRKHIKIDPDKENAKFYNFNLHELGTLDLTAKIDYILAITHQKSLTYVGLSQGTSVGFILLSALPEYNDKVKMFISLGTLVYFKHALSPAIKCGTVINDVVTFIADLFNYYEFLPKRLFNLPVVAIAFSLPFFKEIFAMFVFWIFGFDSSQLDPNLLPVICSNTPAGASVKQLSHYNQMFKSNQFAMYDYGIDGNLVKYGQIRPLNYNLSKITTSVILHYALNDYLSSVKDVEKLARELANVQLKQIPWSKFNHFDYIYAIDVVELLYNEIISEIKSST